MSSSESKPFAFWAATTTCLGVTAAIIQIIWSPLSCVLQPNVRPPSLKDVGEISPTILSELHCRDRYNAIKHEYQMAADKYRQSGNRSPTRSAWSSNIEQMRAFLSRGSRRNPERTQEEAKFLSKTFDQMLLAHEITMPEIKRWHFGDLSTRDFRIKTFFDAKVAAFEAREYESSVSAMIKSLTACLDWEDLVYGNIKRWRGMEVCMLRGELNKSIADLWSQCSGGSQEFPRLPDDFGHFIDRGLNDITFVHSPSAEDLRMIVAPQENGGIDAIDGHLYLTRCVESIHVNSEINRSLFLEFRSSSPELAPHFPRRIIIDEEPPMRKTEDLEGTKKRQDTRYFTVGKRMSIGFITPLGAACGWITILD